MHGSDFGSDQRIQFRLEYDIIKDIPAEIEEFVRLPKLGLNTDAKSLFDRSLNEHLNLFPVLAEYADFLLEQDNSEALRDCSEFLEGYLKSNETTFSEDEITLLQLLAISSDAKARGDLSGSHDRYVSSKALLAQERRLLPSRYTKDNLQ